MSNDLESRERLVYWNYHPVFAQPRWYMGSEKPWKRGCLRPSNILAFPQLFCRWNMTNKTTSKLVCTNGWWRRFLMQFSKYTHTSWNIVYSQHKVIFYSKYLHVNLIVYRWFREYNLKYERNVTRFVTKFVARTLKSLSRR